MSTKTSIDNTAPAPSGTGGSENSDSPDADSEPLSTTSNDAGQTTGSEAAIDVDSSAATGATVDASSSSQATPPETDSSTTESATVASQEDNKNDEAPQDAQNKDAVKPTATTNPKQPKRRGLFSLFGKGVSDIGKGVGELLHNKNAKQRNQSDSKPNAVGAQSAKPKPPPKATLELALRQNANLQQLLLNSYRHRLEDFYDIFNPEKKADIPKMIAKYNHGSSEMEKMFAALHERYDAAAVLKKLHNADAVQQQQQSEIESLKEEVERLTQQLESKSNACATLQLQVDSDRTLREALQEATHDMSRAMAEATEAAEKKIAEAKDEADAQIAAAKAEAESRAAQAEESARVAKEASQNMEQQAKAKADEAAAVTASHQAVQDALKREVEAAQADCQRQIAEIEQNAAALNAKLTDTEQNALSALQERVAEVQQHHQEDLIAIKQQHEAETAAATSMYEDKIAHLKAQATKYKEQKSLLVEASKRLQSEHDATLATVSELRESLNETKAESVLKLQETSKAADMRAQTLSRDLSRLREIQRARSQSILCNLYSFVMAASSNHSGFLFKRGSAYDGQMHEPKQRAAGFKGLKNALFGSSQERRRYFTINAKLMQYFSSDRDSQAENPSPLGVVPISDIQSLGVLDSLDKSNSASSATLMGNMDSTNYCFEIVLSDRIYSLRAGDRLIRALWLYRLRLLLAIRVQIATHTQLLTESASVHSQDGPQEQDAHTPRKQKTPSEKNLDTLSSKLLQTYAVTFGFTVNKGDEPEQRQAHGSRPPPPSRFVAPAQVVRKMFNEVPSRGNVILDGGGTRIEVIPTFSSSQCLWWKYSSQEIEGMSDEQNRIGFQVMFHPLKGRDRLSPDKLFDNSANDFGHIHDFKHVYADITNTIRVELIQRHQQQQREKMEKIKKLREQGDTTALSDDEDELTAESPAPFDNANPEQREWPGRRECLQMVLVPAFRTHQIGMLESPGVGHISLIWNNVHSPHTDKKLEYWLQVTKDANSPPRWMDA